MTTYADKVPHSSPTRFDFWTIRIDKDTTYCARERWFGELCDEMHRAIEDKFPSVHQPLESRLRSCVDNHTVDADDPQLHWKINVAEGSNTEGVARCIYQFLIGRGWHIPDKTEPISETTT